MYNLAMSLPNYTGVLPQIGEDGKWSGQDLYSMFLPDISLIMNNNSYDDNPVDKNRVVIKNGNYKSGVMDSKIFTEYFDSYYLQYLWSKCGERIS